MRIQAFIRLKKSQMIFYLILFNQVLHDWGAALHAVYFFRIGVVINCRTVSETNNKEVALTEKNNAKHKAVKKYWDAEMNAGKHLDDFSMTSLRYAYWKCPQGHRWRASVCTVYLQPSCPVCQSDSLAKSHPEYAAEWHQDKNKQLTPDDVSWNETKKVWWKCRKGHEWIGSINYRVKNQVQCKECLKEQERLKRAKKKRANDVIEPSGLTPLEAFALSGLWSTKTKTR